MTPTTPCPLHRKLIALLEEKRDPCPAARSLDFSDRLDALEVEALVEDAPASTLVMIRTAREAVEFAERMAVQSRRRIGVAHLTSGKPSGPGSG